nr:MAG TPA: hypothetical protein [Caudoviricetes sp.]
MNRKPKYFKFCTLDEEEHEAQFYRIPLPAIEAYDFEQTSISYSYDTIWRAEEMTKIYTHQFVFVAKQTSEVIAFRDALNRKEKLVFITIAYDDDSTVEIYDDSTGVTKWFTNEADEIVFLLFYKEDNTDDKKLHH